MVNTMGWNERSDPDMRTANFCDVYREGVYSIVKYIFLLHVFICFTFIYIYEFYDIFYNKVNS